jgi:hypothetical protein
MPVHIVYLQFSYCSHASFVLVKKPQISRFIFHSVSVTYACVCLPDSFVSPGKTFTCTDKDLGISQKDFSTSKWLEEQRGPPKAENETHESGGFRLDDWLNAQVISFCISKL